MKELISIIMPFKNCEEFLEETLNSILSQTYTNWELIAVNDHSDDKGVEFIQKEFDDKRIHLFKNEGVGIIKALQLGFINAKGGYITRMDADDIMKPTKLEELKQALDLSKGESVAVGLVHYFKSDGSDIGSGYLSYQNWINTLASSKVSFNEIYKECSIPSPSWMMKTAVFKNIGGFSSEVYPEDYELAFRMYEHKLKIAPTNNIVHFWRDYASRTSRTDKNYQDNRFLELKVNSFLKLDYIPSKELVLLGAGRKGKEIAKLLIARDVKFDWLCGTPNKIGHNIYGKILGASKKVLNNCQVVIAIATKEELVRIKDEEIKSNLYYYFC